ncbi:uncharacterized protein N7473_003955 [Penicillium subrubescens]|uniref:uncharacterized protein n=1 Tax=Penicillium subrubescens TaxID=1316194 RepID=UPI00254582AF|nr:uncharacterized protein N7473_003955 [Penicillium subrubescens]KAJ5907039.1 hypothetical protein N7473_003955 [Penicillium subrubescens]
MAAPATSTPRGTAPTSSVSAPASSSPITASVIKFRCLYTHDLRRKSKRWQDGYLRYHAFNKRVMVYDETGNYIGDHHWRSNDEVQDGDEMELDKGALIQVGERMGTTQTDLSNLFEKRKSSQSSPQANDHTSQTVSQTPRASVPIRSSGSSQPFRSLNELLGIKKTPVGHLVSPYEERHPPKPASNIPKSSERPTKRQKVSSQGVSSIEKAPVNKRNTQSQVVDLTEQEDEPLVTRAPSVAQGQKPRREKHRETAPPKKDLGQKDQPSSVIRSQNVPGPPNATGSDTPTYAKPVVPIPNSSKSNPPMPVPPAAPSTLLNEQLEARRTATIAAKPKSRQAPRETPLEAAQPRQDLGQKSPTLLVETRRKAPEPTNVTLPDPPKFFRPALPSSSESYKSRPPRANPPGAPKDGWSEQSEARKPASDTVPSKDRPTTDYFRARPNTLRMATEKPRRKLMYSALLPGDASQKSGPELSSSSPASRSQPITKPEDIQTALDPLQGIESTNAEFMPSDSTQFILEEVVDVSNPETGPARNSTNSTSDQHSSSLRKAPAKRALDAPFRKSISDPTALRTVQKRPTPTRSALSAVPEQPLPIEEGPWTSEALDLFDFWPPGRPKPASGD